MADTISEGLLLDIRNSLRALPQSIAEVVDRPMRARAKPPDEKEDEEERKHGIDSRVLGNAANKFGHMAPALGGFIGPLAGMLTEVLADVLRSEKEADEPLPQPIPESEKNKAKPEREPVEMEMAAYEIQPDKPPENTRPDDEPIPLAEAPMRDTYKIAEEDEPLQPARPEPPKGFKEEYLDLKPDAGLRKAQDAALEEGLSPAQASAIGRAVADYILAHSDNPDTVYKRELLKGSEAGLEDEENLRLAREASNAARERRRQQQEETERIPLAPDVPTQEAREPLYDEFPHLRPGSGGEPEATPDLFDGVDDQAQQSELIEALKDLTEELRRGGSGSSGSSYGASGSGPLQHPAAQITPIDLDADEPLQSSPSVNVSIIAGAGGSGGYGNSKPSRPGSLFSGRGGRPSTATGHVERDTRPGT